jgi:hypothetical protein
MRPFGMLLCGLAVVGTAGPAAAADLSKIDRRISKEPAYRSKAPRYCLLVFGPEAQTRVWLVQDGDTLYVDRNGNGDLTEDGERVITKGGAANTAEGVFEFEAGEIRDGERSHKNLVVSVMKLDHLAPDYPQVKQLLSKNPRARGYFLGVEVVMPGWKGAGVGGRVQHFVDPIDLSGLFQFAERPKEAPIIHLGGPWQATLFRPRQRLTVGRVGDLVLSVGTPGLGAGTSACIGYEGVIPEKVYPTVEITYPPRGKGATPIKERYELKGRC